MAQFDDTTSQGAPSHTRKSGPPPSRRLRRQTTPTEPLGRLPHGKQDLRQSHRKNRRLHGTCVHTLFSNNAIFGSVSTLSTMCVLRRQRKDSLHLNTSPAMVVRKDSPRRCGNALRGRLEGSRHPVSEPPPKWLVSKQRGTGATRSAGNSQSGWSRSNRGGEG